MSQTTLNTRIVLRNDSHENWELNKSSVLLKGEVGIEFFVDGSTKMKVGDGTKTWEALPYFGGEENHVLEIDAQPEESDAAAIKRVAAGSKSVKGDIAIIKRLIHGDKYSYTAYVFGGVEWAAMDGNYNAKNIYFDQDLQTTSAIGNISLSGGQAKIAAAGKNLEEVWKAIFVKEDRDIKVVKPSASISGNLTYLEVGSSGSQPVAISFDDGSYEYGHNGAKEGRDGEAAGKQVNNGTTGVEATAYTINYGGVKVNASGESSMTIESGVMNSKGTKSLSGSVAYSDGFIPVSNTANNVVGSQIKAGTTSIGSKELYRWYEPMFHGFKNTNAIATPSTISAEEVAKLTKITNMAAYNYTAPTEEKATEDWKQYFIAVPSAAGKTKPSVVDINGLPLTVEKAQDVEINFNGAKIKYNVFFVSLAAAYKTRTIKLTW